MAAETQYTANTGLATINVSNSNTTSTGNIIYPATGYNIWNVITGASNGTLVKTVTVKATASVDQGIVRLWLYDGTNQLLIQEVYVEPIPQANTDISFEKVVPINLKLNKGWSLLASTENAQAFNIIAEGQDFSYFTQYVRPESTNYTANTGMVSISTGTSSTTGVGSSLLLTATSGFNGTAVESITVKATAATTADGMVRIFVYDGVSSYYLMTEVFVLYTSQTGTYKSFSYRIVFPNKFHLKAGYSLYVSTQNSNSFSVVAEAMDWNYPSGSLSNFTPASGTSVTTEQLLHSLQVPKGFVYSGELFNVYANIATNNTANNKTFRIYINTSNSLTGATLLGTHVTLSLTGDNISRLLPIISDTSLECYGGATTDTQNEYATSTGTSGTVTVPSVSAGFWILISGQKAVAGDTDTIRWSMVRKIF
jgi:hypothetical protein